MCPVTVKNTTGNEWKTFVKNEGRITNRRHVLYVVRGVITGGRVRRFILRSAPRTRLRNISRRISEKIWRLTNNAVTSRIIFLFERENSYRIDV